MRRALILGGVWALGVVAAVAFAFAAVARVAGGIAPHDVARLSETAIDQALASPTSLSLPPTTRTTTSTTAGAGSTSTTTRKTTEPTTSAPSSVQPPATVAAPSTTTVTAAPPHGTVTTSVGGTLFTHCAGPSTIVYDAAVPRTGYERVVDIENDDHVEQAFENQRHRSTIEARCSGGAVIARVDEGASDD